ncbi:MAG TPA: hypothetical protein VD886_02525 [Herpetosiphonaceae bacterium]|nr:hypothetical protein [Herpetosiphonaceae bacterium]
MPHDAPAPPRKLFNARRLGLIGLMLLGLLHGLTYALIIPVWEAPDEPFVYEYAALLAELGHVPAFRDHSPAVEARLLESLNRGPFWIRRTGVQPHRPPQTIADALRLFNMPRQIGGDPPLYFMLAAIPLRLTAGWPVEAQVRLLRALNALLLPAAVACAYGAAREIDSERPHLALATAGFIALHPMFAVIGAALNNDGLANLLGAALTWLALRCLRLGLTWRRVLLTAAVLGLALLTKRTTAPFLALAPALAWSGLRRGWRRWRRWPLRRRLNAGLGGLLLLGVLAGWTLGQVRWQVAGIWLNAPPGRVAARTGDSLALRMGDEVFQPLPTLGLQLVRDRTVTFAAYVWSRGPARGRLVIYHDDQRVELPFDLDGPASRQITATIGYAAQNVMFGLVDDAGEFYARDLRASVAGVAGNLLLNGDLDLPALRERSPLNTLVRYSLVRETMWVLGNRSLLPPFPYALWADVLFDSFWGQFGWMSIAFVRGTRWVPLLLGGMALSAAGLAGWGLRRPGTRLRVPARQGRQIAALAGLVGWALALLFLNSLVVPLNEQLKQGRYLFPVLAPIGLLLAFGQQALAVRRWRPLWLGAWLGAWLIFAGAALVRIGLAYGVW